MGMRAVTTVLDHTGRPRRFWAAWVSPEYQIPHLANFITWAGQTDTALTIASYIRYATNHPGTLPADDTGNAYADEDECGDLDYRYLLTLDDDTRAVRLVVRNMRNDADRRVVHTVDRANLYATAAAMCDLLARRAQAYADANNGVLLPGTDLDGLRAAAAEFQRLQQSPPVAALNANLTAQFTPADQPDAYPSLTVAGVLTLAYIDLTGTLRVSVHLDEAADWLLTADGTVPMRIFVGDTEVFHG